jgi:hypothetical protein
MSAAVPPIPAGLSTAELAAQKKRYSLVIAITVLGVIAAIVGVYSHVSLKQAWGLPLFVASLFCGFGAQIAFIVGLVRSSRPSGRV